MYEDMFEVKESRSKYDDVVVARYKTVAKWFTKTFSNPEKFFIIFTAIFGLIFVFLIPPMHMADEQAHFFRSYQTADLDFFADKFNFEGSSHYGYSIPVSVYEASEKTWKPVAGNPLLEFDASLYKTLLRQPLEESSRMMVIIDGGSTYTPISYIPQAVGVGIAKIMNAPPIILMWAGRLANLTFWLTVVLIAIRLFPYAKWGLVILALNPITLSIAASMSADVVNISLAFLFTSLILYTRKSDTIVSSRLLSCIALIAILLCLGKPTNLPLLALMFLIPVAKLKNLKFYLAYVFSIGLLGLLITVSWNNYIAKEIINTAVQYQRPGGYVVPSEQIKSIISDPLKYIETVSRNFVTVDKGTAGDAVVTTYFGYFSWLDTSIPTWTQILYWTALSIGVMYQFGRGIVMTIYQKLLLLGIFALVLLGGITAMYINYTPVSARIIEGVQGRYFMPASIVLLPIFSGPKKILNNIDKKIPLLLGSMMLVVLGVTVIKLYARFYSV